jgi:hypothetical protein
MHRFRNEIIAVLLIKLLLIIGIKMIWFSDPAPVDDQSTAARLLAPNGSSGAATTSAKRPD